MGKDKLSAQEKLAQTLVKNRVIFFAALIVAVVAIGAILVISISGEGARKAATLAADAIETKYADYAGQADPAKKGELKTAFLAECEKVAKESGGYDAQLALMYLAMIEQGDLAWDKAAAHYQALIEKFPSSYLAATAASSLGYAYEEAGKVDEAIKAFEAFLAKYEVARKNASGVEEYVRLSADVPHAYFSLGRILESEKKDYAKAVETYQKIVDRDSAEGGEDWTKLAKDRILQLKATGLAK